MTLHCCFSLQICVLPYGIDSYKCSVQVQCTYYLTNLLSLSISQATNVTTALKGATTVTNSNQTAQILTQSGNNPGVYNIIQPQQIQIEGENAIIFQNGQQITIPASQLLSPNQSIVRQGTNASTAQTQAGQQVYIQGLGNAMLSNGQQVSVRQGNMVQALQLPGGNLQAIQQTIPVQTISTQNGQAILQTIQFPIQALQQLNSANVQQQQLMPQLQQVRGLSISSFYTILLTLLFA